MRNKWVETIEELTTTLKCMRQTFEERELFIKSLIADVVRLRDENKKLADLIGLLTTKKGE